MGKFLLGLGSFFILFALLIFSSYCFNILLLRKSNLFEVHASKHILVLGDSHTKYAIDDSRIPSIINFSDDADSYYYSYLKLKAIKEKSPQIDTLLLAFSSHNIEHETEVKWLLNPIYIKSRFRFYHNLMSASDLNSLIKLKAKDVFINLPSILTYPLHLLRKGNELYGGYEDLEINDLQGAIKRDSLKNIGKGESAYKYAELEIVYLDKIRTYCKQEGIQLILFSTPIFQENNNQAAFSDFYKSNYAGTLFIDMSKFKLQSDCFGDLIHLNKKGAGIFSDYINYQGLSNLENR